MDLLAHRSVALRWFCDFYYLNMLIGQEKRFYRLGNNSQKVFKSAIAKYILQKKIGSFMSKVGDVADWKEFESRSLASQDKREGYNVGM